MNLEDLKPYQELINKDPKNKDFVKSMEKYQKNWAYYFIVRNEEKETILKNIDRVEDVNAFCLSKNLPPLYSAVERKDLELAKLLIEKGCDVNAFCCGQGTVLDYALIRKNKDFSAYFKSQNAMTRDEMVFQNRRIIVSLEKGDFKTADSILKERYNNKFGFVVRHALMDYAVRNNKPKVVEYIFSKGQDMHYDLEKRRNCTWLHYAAYLNADKVIPLLLEKGFNPNEMTNKRETSLFYAVRGGSLKAIEVLIENGANPHLVDMNKDTLLHHAASKNQPKMFSSLVGVGLDMFQTNANGQTPMDKAHEKGAWDIVFLIEELIDQQLKQGEERLLKLTLTTGKLKLFYSARQNEG